MCFIKESQKYPDSFRIIDRCAGIVPRDFPELGPRIGRFAPRRFPASRQAENQEAVERNAFQRRHPGRAGQPRAAHDIRRTLSGAR